MGPLAKRIGGFEAAHSPQYPIRTFKHYYVTPVGGFSSDLDPGEIGIHGEALRQNTEIEPYEDLVTVSKVDGIRRIPLIVRALFYVVPLDSTRADALSKSPRGEAVLGPLELAAPQRQHLELSAGDSIVINGFLAGLGNRRSTLWGGTSP